MMQINKMASIAIMIGGALINVTAFVGGSHLAKYLSGDQNSEKKRRRGMISLWRSTNQLMKRIKKIEQKLSIGSQLMTESRSSQTRILWTQIML